MKEIISFLRDLYMHNERQWFQENKGRYNDVKARFDALTEQLIAGIARFDPTVGGLSAKDCTYRIYRDVRFSKDKSPYKTHMGAYICRGGKKSGYSGYYFHVGTGLGSGYEHGHMLAVGDYMCDPRVLRTLREDICYGNGDFHDIVTNQVSPFFHLDQENMLRHVPSGFDPNSTYEQYLRLKLFCLVAEPDERFMLDDDVVGRTVELFRTTLPFLQYVNRAIEYVKEEERFR